jgi:hypothetical protein
MGTLDSIHGPVDGIPARESACDHAEKLFSREPRLTAPRSDLQTETHGAMRPRANTRPLVSMAAQKTRVENYATWAVLEPLSRVWLATVLKPLGARPQAPSFPPTNLPPDALTSLHETHRMGAAAPKPRVSPGKEGSGTHACAAVAVIASAITCLLMVAARRHWASTPLDAASLKTRSYGLMRRVSGVDSFQPEGIHSTSS